MSQALIYDSADTICAVSTPAGTGGIAVIRLSGPEAIGIADKIWRGKTIADCKSHTAHFGTVVDADGSDLDQAVATIFRGPASYTGDDVIEFSVHGSRWIQQRLVNSLIAAGARTALPGEFTRRAFAAGKLDLAQAEAVADMIASSSKAAHRMALDQMRGDFSKRIDEMRNSLVRLASLLELELDFSEEDVEFASRSELRTLAAELASQLQSAANSFAAGNAIKDGIPVAIVGATNAGKSSLLNALLADDRAIVSDIHGTTRDIIEDTTEIGDYLVRLRDTAGLRDTADPIEQMGIERSHQAARHAFLVLYVADSSDAEALTETRKAVAASARPAILVANKTDISGYRPTVTASSPEVTEVAVSAKNGNGIEALKNTITDIISHATSDCDITVTNARHAEAFAAASQSLRNLIDALDQGIPSDLAAQDLREALYHLSSVTGQITTPEILQSIFTSFCIGK